MGFRSIVVLVVAGVLALSAGSAMATDSSSGGTPVPSGDSKEKSSTKKNFPLPRILRKIAKCESNNNPRAISPDGKYRGKFQFSRPTWRSVGGHGDPAKASEYQQDKRAYKLYKREGTKPWPNCA
jgi:Transglycosylase-like domain